MRKQSLALWYHSTTLFSDESSSSQYTAISVEWEATVSHARTAFKCQVTTAESLAVSVMQEPADIWECRVAKGSRRRRQGVGEGWAGRHVALVGKGEAEMATGEGEGGMKLARLKVEGGECRASTGRLQWRDGCIKKKWFPRQGECGRCSLSGLHSVSRMPLFPSGCTTRPCLILRSHPLTYHVLTQPLVPPPPASALDCTVVSATGIKNGLLCVCCFHAKLHLRFRIMQMAPNVSLR